MRRHCFKVSEPKWNKYCFYTDDGGCLEHAARDRGETRYDGGG